MKKWCSLKELKTAVNAVTKVEQLSVKNFKKGKTKQKKQNRPELSHLQCKFIPSPHFPPLSEHRCLVRFNL